MNGPLVATSWALERSEAIEWALGKKLAQRGVRRVEVKIHHHSQQHNECHQYCQDYPLGAHDDTLVEGCTSQKGATGL